jgi:hypothetical protein
MMVRLMYENTEIGRYPTREEAWRAVYLVQDELGIGWTLRADAEAYKRALERLERGEPIK